MCPGARCAAIRRSIELTTTISFFGIASLVFQVMASEIEYCEPCAPIAAIGKARKRRRRACSE